MPFTVSACCASISRSPVAERWLVIAFWRTHTVAAAAVATLLLLVAGVAFDGNFSPASASLLAAFLSYSCGAHARFRKVLVAGQVAVSVLLLGAAGMCAHSLYNLSSINPGFRVEQIVSFSIDPSLNVSAIHGSNRVMTRGFTPGCVAR